MPHISIRFVIYKNAIMIRKYVLIIGFLMGLIPVSWSQSLEPDAFEKAWSAMEIADPNARLPLPVDDPGKIAFLSSSAEPFSTTFQYLNKYLPLSRYTFSDQLDDYDQLIIAASSVMEEAERRAIEALLESKSAVLLLLGDRPSQQNNWSKAEVLIRANASPEGQALAAQVIFGGVEVGNWSAGSRLGYFPPEIMGVNAGLLRDSIRAIVREGLRDKAYPGAQVLVAYKGKVIYHEAFGYHTYDSLRVTQLTDIYDLASVTKVSSGLSALMKWYGEGRFDIDVPLATYYPDFKGSNKADLPVRKILAHHAQLRPWIPYWQGTLRGNAKYPWRGRWQTGVTNDYRFKWGTLSRDSSARFPVYLSDGLYQHRDFRQKMMKAIRKSPLNEEPGYVYSGLFFYLLPDIVEEQAGRDYETYLKATFYHPLGAHTLTYNPLRFFPKDRIVPTEVDTFFRMTTLHGTVHDEGAAMMNGVSGNAGLFSSANDLAKLFQMYMNRGSYGGAQLISENALTEFAQCQYCQEGNRRGLGFDKPLIEYTATASSVAEAASPNSFGHSGYTGTFAWVDPDAELLFIFLSNRVHPTRNNRKLYQLGIRPRIHTVLYEAIKTN